MFATPFGEVHGGDYGARDLLVGPEEHVEGHSLDVIGVVTYHVRQ